MVGYMGHKGAHVPQTSVRKYPAILALTARPSGAIIPKQKFLKFSLNGGGNTFDIEFDEKGRLYSGDNGTSRGQYYKQGAYFIKNLGKHGAYTNPYTFGHLLTWHCRARKLRFTHAFVKYGGNSLPERYNGHMIAINPLQSYIQLTKFVENGSTFKKH
jgi:hypothetical protein